MGEEQKVSGRGIPTAEQARRARRDGVLDVLVRFAAKDLRYDSAADEISAIYEGGRRRGYGQGGPSTPEPVVLQYHAGERVSRILDFAGAIGRLPSRDGQTRLIVREDLTRMIVKALIEPGDYEKALDALESVIDGEYEGNESDREIARRMLAAVGWRDE